MAIVRKNAACLTCTPVSSNSAELEQSFSSSRFAIMKRTFADIATTIAHQSGRPITFVGALLVIAAWAVTGPVFHFSDT
jgi:Low affinity iron permease